MNESREHPDLAEIFRSHADGLAGAVRGILGPHADVQEILQDAFLRAWKARQKGSPVKDPVAWIFVITMNLARDVRRSSARRQDSVPLEEVDPVTLSARETDPARRIQHDEWLDAARAAIVRLKDTEKEVFLLRTSGGRTFEAIAETLGIPTGTAKTRMRSALQRLRQSLKGFAPPSPAADGAPLPVRDVPLREEQR